MKILVIGAGMSGMTFSLLAKRMGHSVTLAERNERVGKKLALTGNGKCNVGNAFVNADCYNASPVAEKVLSAVPVEQYRDFLQSIGVFTYQDELGRMYPLSDSANNVVDCFRLALEREGVNLALGKKVANFKWTNGKYATDLGEFDRVCLAVGSGSQADAPDFGNLADKNWFTPLYPSLTPLKIRDMDKSLNGLRAKCSARLVSSGQTLAERQGEVQFKEYGLSGICILDLSAVVARKKVQGISARYSVVLDLVPKMDEATLKSVVQSRIDGGYARQNLLVGILHNKLAAAVIKGANTAEQIANRAKNLPFFVDKLLDWSMSQVTAGGIDSRFIDENLALPNGVIALGEALNVDGFCGGFNLYFAAASAIYAASKLK